MTIRNKNNLTDKWQIFADALLSDERQNATQAYLTAYPKVSVKSAGANAEKLLKRTEIQIYIDKAKSERIERTNIDADYVLKRLVEIDEMDVLEILNDDGSVKKITDWPKCWRVTISGIDISELFDYQDGKKELAGLLKKIKWPDKVKNLELLGKHTNVQAFKEVIKHEGEIDMLSPLIAARKRIEARNKQ